MQLIAPQLPFRFRLYKWHSLVPVSLEGNLDAEVVTQDGFEEAMRVADLAMARMSSEQIPPTPENYALWYAHYSGRAPDLSRAIEILSSNH